MNAAHTFAAVARAHIGGFAHIGPPICWPRPQMERIAAAGAQLLIPS
jgi:hypothetical protein